MAFFSVSKANARIAELEKENSDLKAQVSQMVADAATVGEEAEKISARFDQVQVDLATAKLSVSSLTKQIEAKDAEIATHKAALEAKEAEVEKRASTKALAITQAQGQPAVAVIAKDNPGATSKIDLSKLTGLERAIAAHKASQAS